MKKLCIGGPLDGQYVESDMYIFPYTENVPDVPECDTSRELETMHYKTIALADSAGVHDVLVPENWQGSIVEKLLRAYRSE